MPAEWHREYQRRRYHERMALARQRLGGKCASCGSGQDLDFDHVVPGTKTRLISEATNWSLARFMAEVDKCQLLCRPCHIQKSVTNGELGPEVEHGGGKRGKRGCPCGPCRARSRAYMREYQRKRRA